LTAAQSGFPRSAQRIEHNASQYDLLNNAEKSDQRTKKEAEEEALATRLTEIGSEIDELQAESARARKRMKALQDQISAAENGIVKFQAESAQIHADLSENVSAIHALDDRHNRLSEDHAGAISRIHHDLSILNAILEVRGQKVPMAGDALTSPVLAPVLWIESLHL
jgi:chromosome segregation ATPase